MERERTVVGSIGPISVLTLGKSEGPAARAVRQVAPALAAEEQAPRPTQHSASSVALAPASMAALIEAQERMTADTPMLVRVHTAQKIDQLISRLDDGDPPPPPPSGSSFTVRRLQTA